MKPVDTTKLPMTPLPASVTFANHNDQPEHWQAAVALTACYYDTRAFNEWTALSSWALGNRVGPTLGGAHPGRLRAGVDETCRQVEELVAAEQHIKAEAKRVDKEVPKTIASIDGDIEKLEATIAELQEAVAGKRAELSACEAEVQQMQDARELVANVEAEPSHSMKRAVWHAVRSGKHGLE